MPINQQYLKELMAQQEEPCVSLYMPCYEAGREQRQNRIRYKNLLNDTEELLSHEPQAAEAGILLGKLQHLLDAEDHDVWQHPSEGLALFATPQLLDFHHLPLVVDEQVHVGERFYLKPLLPLLQSAGRYFLLAVSQNSVRLFEGSRSSLHELRAPALPKDLEDALNIDEYQSSLQFYSYKRGGDAEAQFHGHGGGEDDHKKELLQYFHRLADPLNKFFADHREPLVFAGVEYLFPIFKEAIDYPHLLNENVDGNVDDASPEKLREMAWAVVEPHFKQQTKEALEAFENGFGDDRSCSRLPDILTAASRGAVSTLLLRKGASCWGQIDVDNRVVIHDKPQETSLDLLDEAAYETLANGGDVYTVAEEQFPKPDEPCVAVLRYPVSAATSK